MTNRKDDPEKRELRRAVLAANVALADSVGTVELLTAALKLAEDENRVLRALLPYAPPRDVGVPSLLP